MVTAPFWLLLVLCICRLSDTLLQDDNVASSSQGTVTTTSSPVVGILAQPLSRSSPHSRNSTLQEQYIAASYVKWLEMGGARSIPIPYDAPPDLLDDILTQINALLLPGGSAKLPPAVTYLLDRIQNENQQGNYFPVWGTCLGFEFLLAHVGGASAVQSRFQAENMSLALEYVQVEELYQDSITFQTVSTRNVTMNNHEHGIEPQHFLDNPKLSRMWHMTSINHDASGRPFASTIEPIDPDRFPFYGVQYHPEKNAFEFATYPGTNIPYEAIDHSDSGVAFSSYMARFVVTLARRSLNENPLHSYTQSDLYPVTGTYPLQTGLEFEQVYHTPPASHWISSRRNHNHDAVRGSGGGGGSNFWRTIQVWTDTSVAYPDQRPLYHVLRDAVKARQR